ncbi:hypothetical protein QUB29_14640, partial [Microcoleus sp. B4b_D2]|uniref:hypothetical protein n=1 Tax=Microcoleus sp. B4b_D2 TaxID=3055310 RepID=UPI002FD38D7F
FNNYLQIVEIKAVLEGRGFRPTFAVIGWVHPCQIVYERALGPVPQEIHSLWNGLWGPFLRMVQELRYNDRQHGNSGYGNAQSVST